VGWRERGSLAVVSVIAPIRDDAASLYRDVLPRGHQPRRLHAEHLPLRVRARGGCGLFERLRALAEQRASAAEAERLREDAEPVDRVRLEERALVELACLDQVKHPGEPLQPGLGERESAEPRPLDPANARAQELSPGLGVGLGPSFRANASPGGHLRGEDRTVHQARPHDAPAVRQTRPGTTKGPARRTNPSSA